MIRVREVEKIFSIKTGVNSWILYERSART